MELALLVMRYPKPCLFLTFEMKCNVLGNVCKVPLLCLANLFLCEVSMKAHGVAVVSNTDKHICKAYVHTEHKSL